MIIALFTLALVKGLILAAYFEREKYLHRKAQVKQMANTGEVEPIL